jgi:hypothetical protein
MLPKNTLAALILILGFLTTGAVAAAVHDRGNHHAGRAHPRTTLAPTNHEARRGVAHHAGYAARAQMPSDFASGYVFVPGRGILGEDCDMPTSTCPNELRDTQ